MPSLPDTRSREPDNVYFGHDAFSWNFNVNGHKATLGFIVGGFTQEFPAGKGGEKITFLRFREGAELTVEILDDAGESGEAKQLTKEDDTIFVPEGRTLRVKTGNELAAYVCEYPGQPSEK